MAETTTRTAQQATSGPATGDAEQLMVLLAQARGGDHEAMAGIVEACTPMVRGTAARHVANAADVDDVVQEVWLALAQNIRRITNPLALRGWLLTVTVRAAWRHHGRTRRFVPMAEPAEVRADDDTEAEATRGVHLADVTLRVNAALGFLRPADRRMLELLTAQDRPDYRAVSRATQRPIGSIGPTRRRAMDRLRHDPQLQALAATV